MSDKAPIKYEDVIKAIDDFEREEPVNINPNVVIPYYVLDNMGAKLSRAITELKKKDKIIDKMVEKLSYVEELKLDVCVNCKEDCRIPRNQGDCIKTDCIKEYFKKKVEVKDE